jgi:hypothetical protein
MASASCHRIFKDFDEMERQQSHEMRGIAWFCEITLTPAWPQYAGIPHPTRPPGGRYPMKAVSGKPPRQLVLQALPIPWTVGGIASGGGADGEGAVNVGLLFPNRVGISFPTPLKSIVNFWSIIWNPHFYCFFMIHPQSMLFPIFHPVTLSPNIHGCTPMEDVIKQCCSNDSVLEDLPPICERLIRRKDSRSLLVAP